MKERSNMENLDNKTKFVYVGTIIMFVLLILTIVILWRTNLTKANELDTIKAQINITEDISKTKAKLDEMKKREAEEYVVIAEQQKKLRLVLSQLDYQQKQLARITKEGVKKNVEKLNIVDLHREFADRNISNTIIIK
jgi:hypothetical protein